MKGKGMANANGEEDWLVVLIGFLNVIFSFLLALITLTRWMHIDDVASNKALNADINPDANGEDGALAAAMIDDMFFSSKVGMDYVNKYSLLEVAAFTMIVGLSSILLYKRIWFTVFLVLIPGLMIFWRRVYFNQHIIIDKSMIFRKKERKRFEHDAVFAMFASFIILLITVFM